MVLFSISYPHVHGNTRHVLTYVSPGSDINIFSFQAVGLYCVFIVDWGDKEHVFMPVSGFLPLSL